MLSIRPSLYGSISGILFLGIGVLHGLRAYYEWDMVYHTWEIPIWISWLIALLGFLMALTAVRSLR